VRKKAFLTAFASASLVALSIPAYGFESDVHFGLTQWLALQAGYTGQQAQAIAVGDQRVDSGDMQFISLLSEYACGSQDLTAAEEVRSHHFPSEKGLPNLPANRSVVAGGEASKRAFESLAKVAAGRESYLLYQLGAALHVFQDSWSNQGIPDVPRFSGLVSCDPTLVWAHPAKRGGWNSHRADLTELWPIDTREMAAATYEALAEYPAIEGRVRNVRAWSEIAPLLKGFVDAKTKQSKAKWFRGHGIADASFLEGISLPDGSEPFLMSWNGRKLPALPSVSSRQHQIAPDLLLFFNTFFQRWLIGDDFTAMALEFGSAGAPARGDGKSSQLKAGDAGTRELAARLRLWRIRDHGSVADLAHATSPLGPEQIAELNKLSRGPGVYADYDTPMQALIPFLPDVTPASPLLPFLITMPAAPAGAAQVAIATVRFRHAPHDGVEIIAERRAGKWGVVAVTATVED
jgi:hypothetical protein